MSNLFCREEEKMIRIKLGEKEYNVREAKSTDEM